MNVNINLLPWREKVKKRKKREFFFMTCLSVMVIGGLLLYAHTDFNQKIQFQHKNNDYLKNQIKKIDSQIAEIETLQREKQQCLARMKILQQLQSNRSQVVRFLDVIAQTVPEGLYLSQVTRFGENILIDGKARSNAQVSTFMRNIEKSLLLKNPLLNIIHSETAKEESKTLIFNLKVGT